MFKRFLLTNILSCLVNFVPLAHADVPVYDDSQNYMSINHGATQAENQDAANSENSAPINQSNSSNDHGLQQPFSAADENNEGNNESYNNQTQTAQEGSIPERIARLEQQIANIQQMNLVAQVQSLQQEVQTLQGQLEMQSHKIATLESQLQPKNSASNNAPPIQKMTEQSSAQNNIPTTSASNSSSSTSSDSQLLQEQSDYAKAYQLITSKKYPNAITSLQSYIKKYPNGNFVANAHYWLGELYYLQHDMSEAETEFTTVINNYPNDQKIADAKLKLGFIFSDTGQTDKATQVLNDVVQSYPGTTMARLAEERLHALKRLN